MTDNTSNLLPQGIRDAIGKAAELNQSTTVLHDQKSHPQLMREGMFKAASSYAGNYKKQHPSAAALMTRIETLAYKPKPSGYAQYIDIIVDGWLSGKGSCKQTNRATIARISDRFPEYKFSKDLLNKPLSKAMADRIKAKAAGRGLMLDTRLYDTLSKIKAAALKGELATIADRPIRINATLTDNHLAGLKIDLHGKRQSVRITHDGKRRRIYIDDLIALSEYMAGEAEDNQSLSSGYTIKMLAQETRKPAELRQEPPETDILSFDTSLTGDVSPEMLAQETCKPAETLDKNGRCSTGDVGPNEMGVLPEPSMTERIAALRANIPADDTTSYPADYDPLCHL